MAGREEETEPTDEPAALDSQEVFDWEPRSLFDRFVYGAYPFIRTGGRLTVVLLAGFLLVQGLAPAEFAPVADPVILAFVGLSIVPAFALVGYVWYSDLTSRTPVWLLVVTFGLGLLFANFAAVINEEIGGRLLLALFSQDVSLTVARLALFVLVVAPAEELVKLLAVYFKAYQTPQFDSVITGAVFGAVAGLGFATIENALYISRVVADSATLAETITDGSFIASVRALAGPGHVIWSAIAGYYLGLARFNRHHAGPLVLKGLLFAIVFHALYNVLVTEGLLFVNDLTGIPILPLFFSVAIAYNGTLLGFLIYKISRYRAVHQGTYDESRIESELTEFDP